MKSIILYDSAYGNTEQIARTIQKALSGKGLTRLFQVNEVNVDDIRDTDLLVVGSPTQGGRPTQLLDGFLKGIPDNALRGVKVAAFDTRFDPNEHGFGLKLLMNVIHFAADKIAGTLRDKGGKLSVDPEGFVVEGREGPLRKGELDRAARWAEHLS